MSDEDFSKFDGLYSEVLSDVLDRLGIRENVMDPGIRPMYPDAEVVGRAKTLLAREEYELPEDSMNHYMKAVNFFKSIEPEDVIVADATERSPLLGELLSWAGKMNGAKGAVVDPYVRDIREYPKMDFPVFSRGTYPPDSTGRAEFVDKNLTVEVGGVTVNPGDIIFADICGVVVIPEDKSDEVVEMAREKKEIENSMRDEIRSGKDLAEVVKKYQEL